MDIVKANLNPKEKNILSGFWETAFKNAGLIDND
jgi:hypothetical protein